MRQVLLVVLISGLSLASPRGSVAQDLDRQGTGAGTGSGSGGGTSAGTMTATTNSGETYTVTTQEKPAARPRMIEPPPSRWVSALTNVQVELMITDQTGSAAPEKKTVSMVVSSGTWGKIRSAGAVHQPAAPPVVVDLNVDARPFVSVDGPIQLELMIAYSPLGSPSTDYGREKPPTVNQSLTVILQNGKPLIISQAADPVGDRKIIVEAKATVVK